MRRHQVLLACRKDTVQLARANVRRHEVGGLVTVGERDIFTLVPQEAKELSIPEKPAK
jgi:hypothetical protein